MDKTDYQNILSKYISGEEIFQLESFLEDINLNSWLESQIISSSDTFDAVTQKRVLDHILSLANHDIGSMTLSKKKYKKSNIHLRRIINVAAILFPIVIILSVYLYFSLSLKITFETFTEMGEKANVILPEGTKVAINSDSKLTYYNNYKLKNRYLKLRGEAYFDVVHDSENPFVVECLGIKIKALGTKFGITAYEKEDNISVVLSSGKILLITPLEEIEMKPNDRVIYNRNTYSISSERVNAEDYTDWRHNRLRFENETLETIMNVVSRVHNIDIVFYSQKIKGQRFTGTIDNTNIESVLNTIKLTFPIDYRINDGIIYLYEKDYLSFSKN